MPVAAARARREVSGGTLVELAGDCLVVPEIPAAAAALSAEMPVAAEGARRVAAEVSVAGRTPLTLAQAPPITRAVRETNQRPYRAGERSSTTPMVRRSRRTRAARCTGLKLPDRKSVV